MKIIISLSKEDLETLSELFHEVKDYNRNDTEKIKTVMKLEDKLQKQTAGFYEPDTTYDIK